MSGTALGVSEYDAAQSEVADDMARHLDSLTKPKGSLGRLEELGVRLAVIQGHVPPRLHRKVAVVCASDHGVSAEGVSLYPQAVTGQMVHNFVNGGAAINVLADSCGFEIVLVDCGITEPTGLPAVRDLRAGAGTRNFRREPAMTREQLDRCLDHGEQLVQELHSGRAVPFSESDAPARPADIIALGDMGIGNTTTAAAVTMALGAPEDVVDRGTGISAEMIEHKRTVVRDSVAFHSPFETPLDALRALGGFDIATMVGMLLALRGRRIACVLDGFPVTAAAYVAAHIDPAVTSFLFAGHRSKVRGHQILLNALDLEPILDAGMHLGEGTGAVLGGFHIDLAARLASGMASFTDAAVDESTAPEEEY